MTDFFTEDDCDEAIEWHTPKRSGNMPCLSLKQANRLLRERGTVVSCKSRHGGLWDEQISGYDPKCATHTALLINIEPIEQDSAEKILKDWLNLESGHADQLRDEERVRARAIAIVRKGK